MFRKSCYILICFLIALSIALSGFFTAPSALADNSCQQVYKDLSDWARQEPQGSSSNVVNVEVVTMKELGIYTGWGEGYLQYLASQENQLSGTIEHIYSTRTYGDQHPFNPKAKDVIYLRFLSNGNLKYNLDHISGKVFKYNITNTHCSNGFIYGFHKFRNGKHMVIISYKKATEFRPI